MAGDANPIAAEELVISSETDSIHLNKNVDSVSIPAFERIPDLVQHTLQETKYQRCNNNRFFEPRS